MPTPAPLPPTPDWAFTRNREHLLMAIGNPSRWAIILTLCDGESYCTTDLIPIAKCSPSATGKHIKVLIRAGIVLKRGVRLYRLAPAFRPAPDQPYLDFGHIICRLQPKPAAAG